MLKYANAMKKVNEVKYFLKKYFYLNIRLKIGSIYLRQILGKISLGLKGINAKVFFPCLLFNG